MPNAVITSWTSSHRKNRMHGSLLYFTEHEATDQHGWCQYLLDSSDVSPKKLAFSDPESLQDPGTVGGVAV